MINTKHLKQYKSNDTFVSLDLKDNIGKHHISLCECKSGNSSYCRAYLDGINSSKNIQQNESKLNGITSSISKLKKLPFMIENCNKYRKLLEHMLDGMDDKRDKSYEEFLNGLSNSINGSNINGSNINGSNSINDSNSINGSNINGSNSINDSNSINGYNSNGSNMYSYYKLDGKYILIYGYCQSGKTILLQKICLTHICINNASVIIVLRNSIGDATQLKQRYNNFIEHLPIEFRKYINILYAGSDLNENRIKNAINGKIPSIIITIANKTQMNKIGNIIKTIKNPKYIVNIDEADQVAYGTQNVTFRKLLHENILSRAGRVYATSATTFDIFTEDKINSSDIIMIEPKPFYKGLKQIRLKPLSVNESDNNNLMITMKKLGKENVYGDDIKNTNPYNKDHPQILLIKITHIIQNQERMLTNLVIHRDLKMWTGVIYNGNGIMIYTTYKDRLQTIFTNVFTKTPSEITNTSSNVYKIRDKICYYKNCSISEALECLRILDKQLKRDNCIRIKHIFILAGDLANRGISYVSIKFHWHITSFFFITSKSTPISAIIQACGRLCGNFNDNIPLGLYAYVYTLNQYQKGANLQTDVLDRVKNVYMNTNMKNSISIMKISKNKIPPGKLGVRHKELKNIFKKKNLINGQDNGMKLEEFELNVNNDIDEKLIRNSGESKKSYLKRVITHYITKTSEGKVNSWKTAKEWFHITGLCGFETETSLHYQMMTKLVSENFLERQNNKLRLKKH